MWERSGEGVSASLDHVSSVAMLGDDPVATASAALGVARAQARRRRVFVADLLGEGSALSGFVASDDAPGVSDMLHYGVSLGRAAYPVVGAHNLFIVPGGAESPLTEEVLGSPWWEALFRQVHAAGGLVIVAAPALVPTLERLVARTDGVVLVGDSSSTHPPDRVLAEVRPAIVAPPVPAVRSRRAVAAGPAPSRGPWILAGVAAIVLATAIPLQSRWLPTVRRLLDRGEGPVAAAAPPAAAAAAMREAHAAYSVQLLFTNSSDDARRFIEQYADSLPAATFVPVDLGPDSSAGATPPDGDEATTWYRLVAGAFDDSSAADRLLVALRAQGAVGAAAGVVTRTPLALLVDSAYNADVAVVRLAGYRGRGVPAYALHDTAGTIRIYAGAFATEEDGRALQRWLDSLNIQAVLVRRTGSAL